MFCGYQNEMTAKKCVDMNGQNCEQPDCNQNDTNCNLLYNCKSVSDPAQSQFFMSRGQEPSCPTYYYDSMPMKECGGMAPVPPQPVPPPQPPQPVPPPQPQRVPCTPNIGIGVLLDTYNGDCGSQEVDQYGEERSLRDMMMLRSFGCRR